MEEKKESIVFYRSFYEAIDELKPTEYKNTMNAILQYAFDGVEPELKGVAKVVFSLVKPQIDANQKRYSASVENGKKGGAPKGNDNAKSAQKTTQNNLKTT